MYIVHSGGGGGFFLFTYKSLQLWREKYWICEKQHPERFSSTLNLRPSDLIVLEKQKVLTLLCGRRASHQ